MVSTRDAAVETLAAVLQVSTVEVLKAPSLFDLPGFDSVAVVTVLERLEDALGIEVPPELIVPEAFESLDDLVDLFRVRT